MTAEEAQDAALQALLDAKTKQKADRAEVVRLAGIQAQKQVARDAAYTAFLAADKQFTDAQAATFYARNTAEGDDVVLIYNANAAFQGAMQNHGFVNG